jgi:hypothetical protein
VDQDAKENVICVAVVPLNSGSRFYGQGLNFRYELIFREIKPQVKRAFGSSALLAFVLRQTRGMRKKILDENGSPGCGSSGEVLRYAVVERELAFLAAETNCLPTEPD